MLSRKFRVFTHSKDDVLKKFRTASGAGKLSFADAGGHDVSVPLSFNGFNQASMRF